MTLDATAYYQRWLEKKSQDSIIVLWSNEGLRKQIASTTLISIVNEPTTCPFCIKHEHIIKSKKGNVSNYYTNAMTIYCKVPYIMINFV